MAKRFTDTDKWDRPWFRKLPLNLKLLWCFIVDKCDIAGVWYVDLEMASFQIGSRFERTRVEEIFQKQIEVRGDRWLIKDFILFQYGSLEASNKIYRNVTAKLKAFQEGASMPHTSPIDGVMVMDKEKEDSPSFGKSENLLSIPEDLKANEAEIKDWLEYKKQRGESFKPKGLAAFFQKFREIPPDKRREAVNHSMANNWAGLFEKRSENGHKKHDAGSIGKIGEGERSDSKFAGVVTTVRVGGDEG